MKKPKTVADLLAVNDVCIMASKAQALSLIRVTRGYKRRSTRKIGKSMLQNARIRSSNPLSKRRKHHSDDLLMQ
jgi:hypothetical protein